MVALQNYLEHHLRTLVANLVEGKQTRPIRDTPPRMQRPNYPALPIFLNDKQDEFTETLPQDTSNIHCNI